MTWVTFRQHRWPMLLGSVVLLALAAVLVSAGGPIREQAAALGHRLVDCSGRLPVELAGSIFCPSMKELPNFQQVHRLVQLVVLILPAAVGVFVGAPLLAQELEHRTSDFAWTQSVTRRRWLLAKLGLLALATVAVAGLAAALIAWWERPIVDAGLWDAWAWFDHGLALPADALFAFALGVAVGAFARRTVAAMAVTIAVYAATRFAVSTWWRPRFRAPVETAIQRDDQLAGPPGAWVLDILIRDGQGRRLTPEQETEIYNLRNGAVDTPLHDLLAPRGLTQHLSYHPADRLIPFELIEAGIFVTLATLLLGLVFWRIQRRAT